jgi:hypothetical protein
VKGAQSQNAPLRRRRRRADPHLAGPVTF